MAEGAGTRANRLGTLKRRPAASERTNWAPADPESTVRASGTRRARCIGEFPSPRRPMWSTGLYSTGNRGERSFEPQELALDGEAAGISTDASAGSHHPVARDHDGDRIVPQGLPDGPAAAGLPDAPGDLAVGDELPGRHARRGEEHAALEGADVSQVEAHVEMPPLAGEVAAQLVHDFRGPLRGVHHVGIELPSEVVHERGLAAPERDAHQPL